MNINKIYKPEHRLILAVPKYFNTITFKNDNLTTGM
jgi:hypothetical protein